MAITIFRIIAPSKQPDKTRQIPAQVCQELASMFRDLGLMAWAFGPDQAHPAGAD